MSRDKAFKDRSPVANFRPSVCRTPSNRSEAARLTDGRGVDLVIDPVGATLQASLAALRPQGRLVFVGNAGGSKLDIDLWPVASIITVRRSV